MNPKLMNQVVNNLYLFYRAFVANNWDTNVHAPHIQTLSEELTRVTFQKDYKNRLCVSMPPQHSKSSLITIAYSVWLILQNPSKRVLIINAESTLSETFGIQIRDLITKIGPLFGVKLSNVKSSSTHLMFEKNGKLQTGFIRLVGANGSVTGSPADILIIDDPYKGFDDITPTLLEKKISWFRRIVEQRLREDSKLIILHTRWHSNDLIGYIQENDKEDYNFISFPAIDQDDNILWPQYYSKEFYEKKLEKMGEREFQALYQQEPIDETGDYFDIDRIIWEDDFNKYYQLSCRSWDIASSDNKLGDKRDYTDGVPVYKVSDDEYWITDFVHGQFGNETEDKVLSTAKIDGSSKHILIETGTKGGAAELLYQTWKKKLRGYITHKSEPVGTKSDRATPLKYAVYDGKIHVCINDNKLREEFIRQFSSFPNGKHDDIVDACAYAYNYLKDKQGSSAYQVGKQSYKDNNNDYKRRRVRGYHR